MGINLHTLNYIHANLKRAGYEDLEGLKICLFGNLYMRNDTHSYMGYPYKTAMKYFDSLGMICVSFDTNAKDGSLPLDLSKPIPESMKNRFDILVNGGTAEHVSNQYNCFRNAHDLCRKMGLMIHVGPEIGSWPNHCNHWYSREFFRLLGVENNYFIFDIHTNFRSGKLRGNLLYSAAVKLDNKEFMMPVPFKLLYERTAK